MKESNKVARLHLLLVDPNARGLGIGTSLLEEGIHFARTAGYRTLTLWANHVLPPTRTIYEKAGFRLVNENVHDRFGLLVREQTWELEP